jgi:hypothetical protein
MTNDKPKPDKKIHMERSVLTSMEPVVIEMAKLRASQKEQGWGHSEHVDEGQQDEVYFIHRSTSFKLRTYSFKSPVEEAKAWLKSESALVGVMEH